MYCPQCTRQRFAGAYYAQHHPRDEHGLPDYPERDEAAMRDREGNPVRPVFAWDDGWRDESCDRCRDRFTQGGAL